MKVTSTLAVASILSAVLVAAVPIPAEVDTAYYEAITAREIADIILDEIFERTAAGKAGKTFGDALKKAGKDTADMLAQKVYDGVTAESPNPNNRVPIAQRIGQPPAPAAKPPPPAAIKPQPPVSNQKPAPGIDGSKIWKDAATKEKYKPQAAPAPAPTRAPAPAPKPPVRRKTI